MVGAGGLLMTSHDAVDCSSEAEVEALQRVAALHPRPDQTPAAGQHVLKLGILFPSPLSLLPPFLIPPVLTSSNTRWRGYRQNRHLILRCSTSMFLIAASERSNWLDLWRFLLAQVSWMASKAYLEVQ